MLTLPLQEARYSGDAALQERLGADPELRCQFQHGEVLRSKSLLRAQLLSSAVRVHRSFIPGLADTVDRVARHFPDGKPVEAYVFASPDVNAFVAEGNRHRILGFSSGAVSVLSPQELEFVVGHEMGHAVFGHTELCAEAVLGMGGLSPAQNRLVRSWQRASEISADRAGLLFCGSLEVAANALFKTLAGLPFPGVTIDPHEFAEQWSSLADEVMEHGSREHWQLAHPFPPLRMKAMELFWNRAPESEVERLLGMMEDTVASGASDPLLARFQFWGGLYVVLADGPPNPTELEHLVKNLPTGLQLEQGLQETATACLERFQEARRTRKTKLSASELHRIVHGLVAAAAVDGPLNDLERTHLHHLGQALGLRPEAVDLATEGSP